MKSLARANLLDDDDDDDDDDDADGEAPLFLVNNEE